MKKGNLSLKVVGFWLVMIFITVVFGVVIVNKILKVTTFDSMSDINRAGLEITGSLTSQSDSTYYVYIYSGDGTKNVDKQQELEPYVLSYFTYVAKNESKSGIVKIYGYDVDNYKALPGYESVYSYLLSLNSSITASDIPMLVKISSSAVSTVYSTANSIESELQSQRLS